MSRIGKLPIPLPSGVTVNIKGDVVTVKGPKGELSRSLPGEMSIKQEDNTLVVTRPSDNQIHRAYHGLTRTLLYNMVTGVSTGFEKNLEIFGVGFRAEKTGDKLSLRVGRSHVIEVTPRPGTVLSVEGNNKIKVSGVNKETVGQMAAEIRALHPPDAYKGKGIKYAGQVIRLKPGKAGKVVGGK
jgi:large subunit ribosomal protein L6